MQLWKLVTGIWNLQSPRWCHSVAEVPRCPIISTVLQGSWPCYLLVCPAVHVFVKVLPYLLVMPRVPWNTHLQVGTKWHGKGCCFKTLRSAKCIFDFVVSASANPGEVSVFIWHCVEAVRIPIPSFRAWKYHYSVIVNWYWFCPLDTPTPTTVFQSCCLTCRFGQGFGWSDHIPPTCVTERGLYPFYAEFLYL